MALGLIKTTEQAALVCKSDPAIGEETDEWVEVSKAKGAKKKGATIVVVRALNDRELMRCSGTFRSIDYDSVGEASTLQLAEAMENVISAAFIRCEDGMDVCEEVDVVLQSIKLGPLLALGSWVLAASGMGADPT